ncbi:hypothetical protein Kpho02_08290 [Kitasatospora phosalacinea]|uniref:Uncharacterized protein n=1 Tax=Kitasatospora phosalacinea TaxID=2065 RepID=A0A9W6Q232_9ACTN|nr:hypothetical protein Kpho02_08290 [Kitasatospora phosalacinea]
MPSRSTVRPLNTSGNCRRANSATAALLSPAVGVPAPGGDALAGREGLVAAPSGLPAVPQAARAKEAANNLAW